MLFSIYFMLFHFLPNVPRVQYKSWGFEVLCALPCLLDQTAFFVLVCFLVLGLFLCLFCFLLLFLTGMAPVPLKYVINCCFTIH